MKVLIFAKRSNLKNAGGPSGYLYNISEYLKKCPCDEIEFISEGKLKRSIWGRFVYYSYVATRRAFGSTPKIVALLDLFYIFFCSEHFKTETIDYLNSFDFIHIHSAILCVNTFKHNKTNAKIIVTSHSPEPFTDEVLAKAGICWLVKQFPSIRTFLLNKEIVSYDFCDKIMFPVPQAKEPYEQASPLYKEAFKRNSDKFFYVPTALASVDMIEGNYIKTKSGDKDSLKLCYVGRHTNVKGYDNLKLIAKKVWEIDEKVLFYIGGKEQPLEGLSDIRWKELGWVKTPLLLNDVDAFILPNKQTYFDLILLETLRQGTPVVLSRTGGNKWFEQFNLPGLFFYEYGDDQTMIKQILKIKGIKFKGDLEIIKSINREFLKKEFNMPLYISRYIENLKMFLNEKDIIL